MSFHEDSFHQEYMIRRYEDFFDRITTTYEVKTAVPMSRALVNVIKSIQEFMELQIDQEGLEDMRNIKNNLKKLVDEIGDELEE